MLIPERTAVKPSACWVGDKDSVLAAIPALAIAVPAALLTLLASLLAVLGGGRLVAVRILLRGTHAEGGVVRIGVSVASPEDVGVAEGRGALDEWVRHRHRILIHERLTVRVDGRA